MNRRTKRRLREVEGWIRDLMLGCSFSLFCVVTWSILDYKAETKKQHEPLPAQYIYQI